MWTCGFGRTFQTQQKALWPWPKNSANSAGAQGEEKKQTNKPHVWQQRKHSQRGFLNQLTKIPSKPATQLMFPVQKLSHCVQRFLGTVLNLMNNILAESSYQYSLCIQICLDSCETKQNKTKKAEVFDKHFLPVFGTKLNAISTLYNDDEILPTQAT